MEIIQVFIISILSFEILSPPRLFPCIRKLLSKKGLDGETDIEHFEGHYWRGKHESSDNPEAAVQVATDSKIDKQEERIQKMIQKRHNKKQTKYLQQIEIKHEPSKSFVRFKQSQAEEQPNLEEDDKDLQSPENHAVLPVAEAEEDMPARTEEQNEKEKTTHNNKNSNEPHSDKIVDPSKHINLDELRNEYKEIQWINEDDKAELYLISLSIPIRHSYLILCIMVNDLKKFKKSTEDKPEPT